MRSMIFDKTDKGREEIATRKYQLASRLRTLLVMVDGKQTGDGLLQKIGGLGLNEESLAELEKNGFIQAILSAVPAPEPVSAAPQPQVQPPGPVQTGTADILPPGQTQFEAIYHFYTETIKSTIGLRGYGLQLKVEKAASIDDFTQLRDPYLEAVLKAKGKEIARSLRARLDQLLYLGEAAPPTTTIIDPNTTLPE